MKIIVPVCNNPDFIRIQHHGFKKHISEPYEFIVFNDCKSWPDYSNFNNPAIYSEIVAVCAELGIQCVAVPNESHRREQGASGRHALTMNFIFQWMKQNPDEYFIIDSDMFLIRDIDLNKYRALPAAVVMQERPGIQYIWPNLFYFNMHTLTNQNLIDFSVVRNGDSGAGTYKWLLQQKPETYYRIKHLPSCTWQHDSVPSDTFASYPHLMSFLTSDPRNTNGKFFCELYEGAILHYRAGSNWERRPASTHMTLTTALKAALME